MPCTLPHRDASKEYSLSKQHTHDVVSLLVHVLSYCCLFTASFVSSPLITHKLPLPGGLIVWPMLRLRYAYGTPMVRGGHTDFTDFTDIALRAFCSGLVRQAHHESSLARGRVRDYFIPSGLLLMMIVHVTKCSLYEYRVYGVASNHPNKCMVVGIVAEHMELVNIGQRYGYRLLGL